MQQFNQFFGAVKVTQEKFWFVSIFIIINPTNLNYVMLHDLLMYNRKLSILYENGNQTFYQIMLITFESHVQVIQFMSKTFIGLFCPFSLMFSEKSNYSNITHLNNIHAIFEKKFPLLRKCPISISIPIKDQITSHKVW